jgi:flagellar biosynthetic protein FlhB
MPETPENGSKTEEATPRKLEEARRRGDVAKSADVNQSASMAAACAVLAGAGGLLSTNLVQALLPFIASPHELTAILDGGHGEEIGRRAVMAGAPFVLAVLGASALAGVSANILQQGFLWSPEKLAPDPSRVSPLTGLQRMFGIDSFVQFLKTLLKLVVTMWVAWRVLEPHKQDFIKLAELDPISVMAFARSLLVALFSAILTFLAATAAIDFIWQRQRFLQRMRMSREEIKEEHRQSEGDPHIKARIKQIRLQRAKKRMMSQVPKATLVVTNPTHYAVALRYVAGETPAPICVAKGMDFLALKIREVAGQHEIPVIEDPPLARALYAAVDVDETIPREHYEAVAKVIGFILGRRNRPRAAPLTSGFERIPTANLRQLLRNALQESSSCPIRPQETGRP